jgi:hypothetical protein
VHTVYAVATVYSAEKSISRMTWLLHSAECPGMRYGCQLVRDVSLPLMHTTCHPG